MKALITGGTGLVGTKLTQALVDRGYHVGVFTRNPNIATTGATTHGRISLLAWPPDEQGKQQLSEADVVFNLAGAPVAQRWTKAAKQHILNSRIETTDCVVANMTNAKTVLVSASAIGIYPEGDEWVYEDHAPASGFLSDVVRLWEQSALCASESGHRVVCLRIGLVLAAEGGALSKLTPLFNAGLGSAVGTGKHWQSWVHIDDLVRGFIFAAENATMAGVYNAVSPHPVTNKVLSKALAQALGKPFFLPPVPGFALRLLFGKMSRVILASQKVGARRLLTAGFTFQYETISSAMNSLFAPSTQPSER